MPTHSKPELIALRVELQDIAPLVWRRIVVPGQWSFAELHSYLQWTMGWEDAHAHEFHVADLVLAPKAWIQEMSRSTKVERYRDEKQTSLLKVVSEIGVSGELEYHYDMGDGWVHRLVVEQTPPMWKNIELPAPACTAGENACPPEEVGGPAGYAHFLECIADPSRKGYAEMLQWIGGVFDPKGFDLNSLNSEWRAMRRVK
jgi:hypothetical protein